MKRNLVVWSGAVMLMSAAALWLVTPAVAAKSSATTQTGVDQERLALERQGLLLQERVAAQQQVDASSRLELERSKLKLEEEKLRVDKSRNDLTTYVSVVPLLAAILTVAFGVWSFVKQARLQTETQANAAKLAFEIKAAEIAFATDKPASAVLRRGLALKAMFPDRLPVSFFAGLQPEDLDGKTEPSQEKKHLMDLLAANDADAAKIIGYWQQLFPGDHEWTQRIAAHVAKRGPSSDGKPVAGA